MKKVEIAAYGAPEAVAHCADAPDAAAATATCWCCRTARFEARSAS